jgi:hypothetical protein
MLLFTLESLESIHFYRLAQLLSVSLICLLLLSERDKKFNKSFPSQLSQLTDAKNGCSKNVQHLRTYIHCPCVSQRGKKENTNFAQTMDIMLRKCDFTFSN